jgi:hypothetical protein
MFSLIYLETMKRVSIFLLIFIFFSSEDGISQQINRKVYHTHQLGFEAGIGDNSAGGTRFPFGSSVGGFYRYKNYMFGFRRDFFSDLNIFSPTTYYKYINGYLAFAFQKKNTFLSPQIGFGYFETNYLPNNSYINFGAEISVNSTIHIRGNGLGMRIFSQFNNKSNYVGLILNTAIGWSWNKINSNKK